MSKGLHQREDITTQESNPIHTQHPKTRWFLQKHPSEVLQVGPIFLWVNSGKLTPPTSHDPAGQGACPAHEEPEDGDLESEGTTTTQLSN